MNLTFKLVRKDESPPEKVEIKTDWDLCFICQQDTEENLICPVNKAGASYCTLGENLLEFNNLRALPRSITVDRLDDGSGLVDTLVKNKAKFHKTCSLKYNTKELTRARKRSRSSESDGIGEGSKKSYTRSKSALRANDSESVCFFCGGEGTSSKCLHEVCTFHLDERVRRCANTLQNEELIAKLSAGDMVAIEAKYHRSCLVALYKRDLRARKENKEEHLESKIQGRAFAELISFIQLQLEEEVVAPVFRLRDLVSMYEERVLQLGGDEKRTHPTRLKHKILNYLPELSAHSAGRDVLLVCADDVGGSLRRVCDFDAEEEAVILSRAANIVRRDLFQTASYVFEGTFPPNCQENSVPDTLLTLNSMILNGTSIDERERSSQPVISISQLMAFNISSCRRSKSGVTRHSKRTEAPLPLYIGSLIHSMTRSKELIETFHALGLSVSYDRVLSLSADLGNSVVQYYNELGKVCPPGLRKATCTTSAVDNIDHNPSATSAASSFHGTGISLFQHVPAHDISVASAETFPFLSFTGTKVKCLPEYYTAVCPVPSIKKTSVPAVPNDFKITNEANLSQQEFQWCQAVTQGLGCNLEIGQNELEGTHLSWAAYHSTHTQKEGAAEEFISTSSLLPLFSEDSKSVAMIRHTMDVVKSATDHVNPEQIPVMACDQPLFKLAKDIQWAFPEQYGEDLFVVMLGGLHIELALLKCLGNILQGSGWTSALQEADVASGGTAESFLRATHIKKTRRAHQVTACALYALRKQAYEAYCSGGDEDDPAILDEAEWCKVQAEESPQFFFWNLILQIELSIFTWLRSVHAGDFDLYVKSLANLQWLFFALDHQNYARAVAVHLRDMVLLRTRHPRVYEEFQKGKFTLRNSTRPFSRMAIDEGHEHNNAVIKGVGGAVGLTENPAQLLRWMVAGPEMARVAREFSSALRLSGKCDESRHHEDMPAKQKRFLKHVQTLTSTMVDMGNPFCDSSGDLLVLDSRQVIDSSVTSSLRQLQSLGESQAQNFMESRLVKRTVAIDEPLKRNKVPLFSTQLAPARSRKQEQIVALKQDRNLFSRLYVACQVRQGDLDEFFRHENQAYPPALTDNGELRFSKKSDLLDCLQTLTEDERRCDPVVDMIVIGGAAAVNFVRPDKGDTFNSYAERVILYLQRQFSGDVRRVDVVFDVYRSDSLKSAMRLKRGMGKRQRVEGPKKIPTNWADFLRHDNNKEELFKFLADLIYSKTFPGKVVVTVCENVLCSRSADLSRIVPCSQEEADTRMLLHVADGSAEGCRRILIRTVDTDVVIIATALLKFLPHCDELWIGLGVGKSYTIINTAAYAQQLGEDRCKGLLGFHALTGCDTTSSFRGKGKRTAFAVWTSMPEVNAALRVISQPSTPEEVHQAMPLLERYVVGLYDRCSECNEVDSARRELFTRKGRAIENIPPTQDALRLHVLRSAFQAGHIWSQSLIKDYKLPEPADFGWYKVPNPHPHWKVLWTTLPPAGKVCKEIISCSCQLQCTGRCSCKKACLPCTSLCKCGGCGEF